MKELFNKLVLEPLIIFYQKLINLLPRLVIAFMVFLVGLIIAFLIKYIIQIILKLIHFEKHSENLGLTKALSKGGIKTPPSILISKFIQWIIILIFGVFSLYVINIPTLDKFIEHFLIYLPNIFIALVIIIMGFMLSNFLGRAALIASVNAGFKLAGLVGKAVKTTILLFSFSIALEQLGIGKDTVILTFSIIFGGIIVAFAIAFGLGGKEMAKEYLEQKLKGKDDKDDFTYI